MKKGIWLSIGAVVFIGAIVFAIWYINETREMRVENRDAFIPYNSAVVITLNEKPTLSAKVEKAFEKELRRYQKNMLARVTDSLQTNDWVVAYPYVVAVRLQGKDDVTSLYVLEHKNVLARTEMADYLNRIYGTGRENVRKYDRYKIYTLKQAKETVYFAVCGGFILLSDSDLYIEDALKQLEQENNVEKMKSQYQNLDKYFL